VWLQSQYSPHHCIYVMGNAGFEWRSLDHRHDRPHPQLRQLPPGSHTNPRGDESSSEVVEEGMGCSVVQCAVVLLQL
jgi:hypothetical protein